VRAACALAVLLAACAHGDAFTPEVIPPNPITTATPPRRLTFSPEGDWSPTWLPDGSAIGYSYHVLGRRDRDRCLGFLPPEGGRITRSICVRSSTDLDTANVASFHAVSPGGRLAIVADAGLTRLYAPVSRFLYLGSFDSGAALTPVIGFPTMATTGLVHYTAMNITWVSESTLVYLATFINYVEAKIGIPADTVHVGIEVVKLRLSGDHIVASQVIPNTLGVTSLCRGTRANTIAFTRGPSSAVYEMDLATLQVSQLYDFGALGIARDVQVSGGRLVAVVGGRVTYVPFDLVFGIPFLADSGGQVFAATLPAGAPVMIVDTVGSHQYRRPALAPSGRRVVLEEFGFEIKNIGGVFQTVVSKEADLWMFDVP
jgi:hypothetical protein